MIKRIWHGWTKREDADAYQRLLDEEIVPGIIQRRIPGLLHVDTMRRCDTQGAEVEFVTIMTFDEWSAVEAFAGDHTTGSVVPQAARQLLSRFDRDSQHYELMTSHPGQASRPDS